jgi:hypothetical protein
MKRIVLTLALLLAVSVALLAQPGSLPARRGHASVKFGDTPVDYTKVSGTFMQSAGYTVITINFSTGGTAGVS